MNVSCRKGFIRNVYKISVWKPEGNRPLVRLGVNGRILLKQISQK